MEDFRAVAEDPYSWFKMAGSLCRAAGVLEARLAVLLNESEGEEFDGEAQLEVDAVLRALMMLAGFAVENALKADLVAKGEIRVLDNGQLKGANHELQKLAAKAQLEFGPSEIATLEHLRHALWAGKYNSAKSAFEWQAIHSLPGDMSAVQPLVAKIVVIVGERLKARKRSLGNAE